MVETETPNCAVLFHGSSKNTQPEVGSVSASVQNENVFDEILMQLALVNLSYKS